MPKTAPIDMGAFEIVTQTCPADFNADGFIDFSDFVAAFEDGC